MKCSCMPEAKDSQAGPTGQTRVRRPGALEGCHRMRAPLGLSAMSSYPHILDEQLDEHP